MRDSPSTPEQLTRTTRSRLPCLLHPSTKHSLVLPPGPRPCSSLSPAPRGPESWSVPIVIPRGQAGLALSPPGVHNLSWCPPGHSTSVFRVLNWSLWKAATHVMAEGANIQLPSLPPSLHPSEVVRGEQSCRDTCMRFFLCGSYENPLAQSLALALSRLPWSLPPPPAHLTHGPAFHLPAPPPPERAPAPWLAALPLPRRCRSVGKDT